MLRTVLGTPRRVLLTVDAVGGVWRYAVDLARGLGEHGVACLLAGLGPPPSAEQREEAARLRNVELTWTGLPLDWLAAGEQELRPVAPALAQLGRIWGADLLHLNVPSQAAGLPPGRRVIVASHSCVPTWWHRVRGGGLPPDWRWQFEANGRGLARADAVLVPSASHGAALREVYGDLPHIAVVHNAARVAPAGRMAREDFVLAAGRWWDEAKNGAVLDEAAATAPWPVLLAGPLAGPNGTRAEFRHAQPLGAVAAGQVLMLMRCAAIFAAPSRYEPFGLAVLEAALSGLPLVLADIPTFRELWDGAAVFVPPGDPEAWSGAFAALAAAPLKRAQLGAAARERAARYTPQRQLDAVLAAYAMAAGTPATAAA